ncbi:MAG: HAMP domain-containing histidine kinase [Polyangiaceae bacterium]|nr:HAMP domain-containing histidine kinase [Polyangiaceae bacterium]
MSDATTDPSGGIVLRWLIALRWAVFALLAATLPVDALLFGYHVHYAAAVPVLALAAAVNLFLIRRLRAADRAPSSSAGPLVSLVVAADLVAIGVVLAASGGAGNPFSALFFVHIALAAALLPLRATIGLAALAGCVFAALFALPAAPCCPNHPGHGAFSTHLYGMLAAFVLSSGLAAYFLHRVRRALDDGAAENARLRRRAEDASRFQALGALAAGTAHELGTPLGTIAVLADEAARDPAASDEARRRARVIAEQVERCRAVLARMRASIRPADPRAGVDVAAAALRGVDAWRAAHPGAQVLVRVLDDGAADLTVALDPADIEAALHALLDNALHAMGGTTARAPIVVTITADHGAPVLSVEDEGAGVPEALAPHLGEPFLSTKAPGEGMGLGLYLIRSLIEPLGGRLDVTPRRPAGTRVALRLAPASA